MLIKDVEIFGHGRGDCRIRGGLVIAVRPRLDPAPTEEVLEGNGGALLPGLADHHLHLAAMAAREHSLDLTDVGAEDLLHALARHPVGPDGWVRVTGYDGETHGELDRHVLDRYTRRVPVRVQHRSDPLWVLSSAGLDRLGSADHPGLERDAAGRPTGRLWRADDWLASRIGPTLPPSQLSLRAVGQRLASYGITHVSDASPGSAHLPLLLGAVRTGAIPQHLLVMAVDAEQADHRRVQVGPVKIVLSDHRLPELAALARRIGRAHERGRPVAVHCTSRAALSLTLAASDLAGRLPGDRIEHCAVAGPDLVEALAERRFQVVTQPTLLTGRGDEYLAQVAPEEREELWPYGSLLAAGVPVVASSDAPYGDPDPWACLRSATSRRTRTGKLVGAGERVPGLFTLTGMLSPLDDPGGPPRRIAVGGSADLVVLDGPLEQVLTEPAAERVVATLIEGVITHSRL